MSPNARKKWVWACAIALAVLGQVTFVVMGIKGFSSLDNMSRFAAPGAMKLTLRAANDYTIYTEHKSVLNGQVYSVAPEDLGGLKCEIMSPTGQTVPVITDSSSSSYTIGRREGASLGTFHAYEPGEYTFTSSYVGRTGPGVVIAVEQNGISTFIWVFGAIMIGLLTLAPLAVMILRHSIVRWRAILKGNG